MTQVVLDALCKRYDRRAAASAVDDLNLTIEAGELVALLGPSGCGKTTTLRMIAGLLSPTGGDIRFDGRSVLSVPAERRGAVMVFQKHLLLPHLSVSENVGFGLKMRGVDKSTIQARVEAMLARVQLEGYGRRRAHELSGGQQQRVALARALVVEPAVLLLDEPLANLDANLRLEMRKLIRRIQQEMGITTLFVTHDQEEAVMLADRVALMMAGRLCQFDTPRTLYERPASAEVAQFVRNENLLPATKRGTELETALGCFRAPDVAAAQPDGPVLMTVRPEHCRLAQGEGANILPVTVEQMVYLGSHIQGQFCAGGRKWTVHLPPETELTPGAACRLYLPPERIWLMPPD